MMTVNGLSHSRPFTISSRPPRRAKPGRACNEGNEEEWKDDTTGGTHHTRLSYRVIITMPSGSEPSSRPQDAIT